MPDAKSIEEEKAFRNRVFILAVRLSALAVLTVWCFLIVAPFVETVIWGVIIAIAVQKPFETLANALGGRPRLAAGILVLAALLVLIIPTVALTANIVETATDLSGDLQDGQVKVPPPPDKVAEWPIIGDRVYALWGKASVNLDAALAQIAPQLKKVGLWLVSTVGTTGVGILLFVVSIIIAGILLLNSDRASAFAKRVGTVMADEQGERLVDLAGSTIKSVTRGVLGVAAIQALLSGVGMLVVGVPAAGLWTLLVLIVAVVQIPPLLILIPVVIYVFSTSSTTVAVLFAIWAIAIGMSDNFLKPLLMGRGSDLPTLVIFLGAIGGFMLEGIIGLFVGAVVLALGYTLFMAWLDMADEA